MLAILEKIFPSIANHLYNNKVRNKIKNRVELALPSNDTSIDDITIEDFNALYESDMRWKEKLEDKAKTNVIGVTISVTLMMGAYSLIQNVSGKFGSNILFWIAFCLFILSVVYMLEAGIHAIHVLTAENVVYTSPAGLKGNEKKNDMDLQIGLTRAQNTLRNNYIFTSYECIRNALICLFCVMIIAIIPVMQVKPVTSYNHGNYFYSEQAMQSLNNGVDQSTVEAYIDTNITDGEHSVVDQSNNLFIKYLVKDNQVIIYIVEAID